jgi:predicted nucleic acid-binding Zn ribbon protein
MIYRFKKENASRRPGAITIGDAIGKMLDTYRLRPQFDESSVKAYWEKLVGHEIASRTNTIYVKDKILFLQLSSAPLTNELVIAKRKLIESLNKEFGYELITDIVFI